MDVPGALFAGVEGVGAQYLAVGGDDQGVVVGDLLGDIRDAGWLAQGEPEVVCEAGDRRRPLFASPTPAGVGLGDDEARVVVGGGEGAKYRRGEIGRAGEGYSHG